VREENVLHNSGALTTYFLPEANLARRRSRVRVLSPPLHKVSKSGIAYVENHGPVEDRHEDLGDYTVNFVTFGQTIDATPLLKGLPDDRCSSQSALIPLEMANQARLRCHNRSAVHTLVVPRDVVGSDDARTRMRRQEDSPLSVVRPRRCSRPRLSTQSADQQILGTDPGDTLPC